MNGAKILCCSWQKSVPKTAVLSEECFHSILVQDFLKFQDISTGLFFWVFTCYADCFRFVYWSKQFGIFVPRVRPVSTTCSGCWPKNGPRESKQKPSLKSWSAPTADNASSIFFYNLTRWIFQHRMKSNNFSDTGYFRFRQKPWLHLGRNRISST